MSVIVTTVNKLLKTNAKYKIAIVRSMTPIPGVEQWKELSPSSMLFGRYLGLKNTGNWGESTFQSIYVPQFLQEIANSREAAEALNKIYYFSTHGDDVAIGCFCTREDLCHRSIVAGILRGVGCDVITLTGNDYSKYYDMYVKLRG